MRLSLRWKILLLVLFTPVTLALATLLTVRRNVSAHVDSSSIHEGMTHSVSVFEGALEARLRELAVGARVIARDPRFFSLMLVDPAQRDDRFVTTLRGTARDFHAIAPHDLFEILDRRGRVVVSVGPARSSRTARQAMVLRALRGESVTGVLVERGAPYQVALEPMVSDGRLAGVLLLGRPMDSALARELRDRMRCEVTFVDATRITGTTLATPGDRRSLATALRRMDAGGVADLDRSPVQRLSGDRQTYLTLVRRIPGSDPAARLWYVMQRSFDPEVEFQGAMRRDLLLLGVLALLAASATGLLLGGHVVRPVRRLVGAAQAMERGDYEQPLGVRGGDELGYLAERFDEMRHHERAHLEALEQAQRVKSRFLSVISHELRTPISVLSGYLELFEDGHMDASSDEGRRALKAMREHLGRLTRVAEEAARFAQVKSERRVLRLEPCDAPALVHAAINEARACDGARTVAIGERRSPLLEEADVDAESFGHAVFQLVTNAIRFTPDGGTVEVTTDERDGWLRVAVRDTGVGIEPEALERLLGEGSSAADPSCYHTAEGLEFGLPGLGLGLPIAATIARAHGGRLGATSVPGRGSTFVLEVPMRHEPELRAAA